MPETMKQNELLSQGFAALAGCVAESGFAAIQISDDQFSGASELGIDMTAKLKSPNGDSVLVIQAQLQGQPRFARIAALQLRRCMQEQPGGYGVLLAPFISDESAQVCREEGIGYVDLAGNCFLSIPPIYIRKEGRPNPRATKRTLRSLYSPMAGRVIEVLLSDPRKPWKLEPLSREADVSIGQVHNVKKLLLNRELAISAKDGVRLVKPETLLSEWADNYSMDRERVREFFSWAELADFETDLARSCEKRAIPWAFTGFSAAARIAPMVRYRRAMAYVQGQAIDSLTDELGLKRVTDGANVWLIAPTDNWVFRRSRPGADGRTASLVRIYLDLCTMKGRGEEAAEAVLQEIKKHW